MTYKRVSIFICILALFYLIAGFVFSRFAPLGNGGKLVLNDYVSMDVEYADGNTEHIKGTYYTEALNRGDRCVVNIQLPKELQRESAAVCARLYDTEVTLRYKDKILFSYGKERIAQKKQIGDVLVLGVVPEEAWGDCLTMECYVDNYSGVEYINDIYLVDALHGVQTVIEGSVLSFLVCVAVCVLFTIMFFGLLVWPGFGEVRREGIGLSLFCLSIMFWQMGYSGDIYMVSGNMIVNTLLEYVTLYLVPIFFCFFLHCIVERALFKKLLLGFTIYFIVYAAIAFLLMHISEQWPLNRMLQGLRISMLVALCIVLGGLFVLRKTTENKLYVGATLFYVGAMIYEMLRYYIYKHLGIETILFSHSISSLALFVFLNALLIGFLQNLMKQYISKRERERLQNMAYTDGLTGIPNRAACLKYLEENPREDFAVLFYDVNNLKFANDSYGHALGDELIRFVAGAIEKAYSGETDFFGRYGGDEFVAGTVGNVEKNLARSRKLLDDIIKEANERHEFPFEVSIACGIVKSSEKNGLTREEAILLADDRMYENKRAIKEKKGMGEK